MYFEVLVKSGVHSAVTEWLIEFRTALTVRGCCKYFSQTTLLVIGQTIGLSSLMY